MKTPRFLILLTLLLLVGCTSGNENSESTSAQENTDQPTRQITLPPTDQVEPEPTETATSTEWAKWTATAAAEQATTTALAVIPPTEDPSTPTSAPEVNAQIEQEEPCPAYVEVALASVDEVCAGTGRNEICYGNINLAAQFRDDVEMVQFESPGDIAAFSDLQTMQLSPLDTEEGIWGIALMRLQAGLPDALPGENVLFLLFGDVTIDNIGEEDGVQSFYFRSGIGDATCRDAPDSGLLVQTPNGVGSLDLRVNNVNIALGSTAYLQAEENNRMIVSVIEGEAEVESDGETKIVPAGFKTEVEIDENFNPIDAPEEPEPYEVGALIRLPINNLTRPVEIASIPGFSDFSSDADGWEAAENSDSVIYLPADADSNGSICAQNVNEAIGFFSAPISWTGNRTDLVNGSLDIRMKLAEEAGEDEDSLLIQLVSSDMTLEYTLERQPELNWTNLSVPLSAQAWLTPDDETISEEDFRRVLSDLQNVYIQSELNGTPLCMDKAQYTASVQAITPYESERVIMTPTSTPVPIGSTEQFSIDVGMTISSDDPFPGAGNLEEPGSTDVYTLVLDEETEIHFEALSESRELSWSAFNENGRILFQDMDMVYWNDPGSAVLPPGNYTITVQGVNNASGPYEFRVTEITDATVYDLGTLETVEADITGEIASAGSTNTHTFNIERTALVRVAALFTEEESASDLEFSLTGANGEGYFDNQGMWMHMIGDYSLAPGEYTFTVTDPEGDGGSYHFGFWELLEPESFEISVGTPVSPDAPEEGMGNLEHPGSMDLYMLTIEEAGTIQVFVTEAAEDAQLTWSLLAPSGEPVFQAASMWTFYDLGGFEVEPGDYNIQVYTSTGRNGTYGFHIWYVLEPESFEITIPIEVSADTPETGMGNIEQTGASDVYTFTLEETTSLMFSANGYDEGEIEWSLIDPTGEFIFGSEGLWAGNEIGPIELSAGEYMVEVIGYQGASGTYNFEIRAQE